MTDRVPGEAAPSLAALSEQALVARYEQACCDFALDVDGVTWEHCLELRREVVRRMQVGRVSATLHFVLK